MREILFRGKRIDGRGWANGFYISCGGPCILDDDDMFFGADGVEGMYSVDSSTVGQYTGLKDRNGVRIFEGDVVAFDGGRFVVEYFESRMGFGFSGLKGRGVVSGFTMMDLEHLEVIGNVHDNPELLEV